jgi:hypothetical protein
MNLHENSETFRSDGHPIECVDSVKVEHDRVGKTARFFFRGFNSRVAGSSGIAR